MGVRIIRPSRARDRQVLLCLLVAVTGGLLLGCSYVHLGRIISSVSSTAKLDPLAINIFLVDLVFSCFGEPVVTRNFGPKASMIVGGVTFSIGLALHVLDAMFFVKGTLVGVGLGFISQSVPQYLSEMAPAAFRRWVNVGWQLIVVFGKVLTTYPIIKYDTAMIEGGWGWRLGLALGIILTIASFLLLDTPKSLVDRGYPLDAHITLEKIRGRSDIEEEYKELVEASAMTTIK